MARAKSKPIIEYEPEMTCGAALDYYFSEHVRLEVVDQRRIEDAIANLKSFFGPYTLASIGIADCREYCKERYAGKHGGGISRRQTGRAAAPGTVRRELSALSTAAQHVLKWRRITALEVPGIELPKAPEPKRGWLTPEQVAKLLATSVGELQSFIAIAYYTAARRRAVEGLSLDRIDIEARRITFALPQVRGTKKRRPTVGIDPLLIPYLKRQVAGAVANGSKKLFTTRCFYGSFVTLCRKLGMPPASPHILRHSRASHLLQAGKPVWKVAQLLGDTVATVERVYGHASVESMDELFTD